MPIIDTNPFLQNLNSAITEKDKLCECDELSG